MPIDFAAEINRTKPNTEGMSHDFASDLREEDETDKQYLGDVLQNNFDTENTASTGLRLKLANADNFAEKNLVLKKEFPEGEYRVVGRSIVTDSGPDSPVGIWRESPESQWKQVEPDGFDATDVGEAVIPSAISIASEIAAAILTRGRTVPQTIGKIAGGAGTGEIVDQTQQTLRGVQGQSLAGQSGEVLTEAGLSATGGFLASPIVGAGNILSGRGALQVGEEGLEVINAAGRINPELKNILTPGLVTDNPALMLNERQSAALLPGLQRRYRELIKLLDRSVAGKVDQVALSGATKNVAKGVDTLSNAFINRLGVQAKNASVGGEALQAGIAQYDEAAKTMVDGLYDAARKIEEPEFDFTGMANVASDLRAGSRGQISGDVESVIREVEAIRGPITLSDGSVLSVAEQLRNARSGAFDAKAVKPGELATRTTGQASELFKAIDSTLDNPVTDNKAFVDAWRTASTSARERFETLGKAAVIRVAKSESPAKLLQLATPGGVDDLLTLRNTVSPTKWEDFVGAFETQLVNNPEALNTTLKSFDQETLDVLIPRAQQTQWFKMGKEMDRIFDVGVEKVVETQIKNKNVIANIIESANPQRTRTLLRSANETNNVAMRDSVRAGIFDWTWDGILQKGKAGYTVNDGLLRDRLKSLQKSGLMAFLRPQDSVLLRDVETMSRVFKRVIDAGTSIQAAEAAKGIGRLEKGAIRSFIQAGIISHFYLSSTGRRILIGSGKENSKGALLRATTGALLQVSTPTEIKEPE